MSLIIFSTYHTLQWVQTFTTLTCAIAIMYNTLFNRCTCFRYPLYFSIWGKNKCTLLANKLYDKLQCEVLCFAWFCWPIKIIKRRKHRCMWYTVVIFHFRVCYSLLFRATFEYSEQLLSIQSNFAMIPYYSITHSNCAGSEISKSYFSMLLHDSDM